MSEVFSILAINVGSTSTKIAIYENETEKFSHSIFYSNEELKQYSSVNEQYEMRKKSLESYLVNIGYKISDFSAIVSRGGSTKPLSYGGAYEINKTMVDELRYRPASNHAGNLGPTMAYSMAEKNSIKAYIYDSVAVDELEDIARVSGLKDIKRVSLVHLLNSRYAAKTISQKLGNCYENVNVIVAHIGGGITITMHKNGRVVDVVGDDEGPFSPERCGRIPSRQLVDLCYSGKYKTREDMHKAMRGNGGLMSYLNTNSAIEVENMIKNGDKNAEFIYSAMSYQISKGIAELSVVTNGNVDAIVLTGGIAHSNMVTETISERVKFIAPVYILPGENEMKSLCLGCLKVLRGEECIHIYE